MDFRDVSILGVGVLGEAILKASIESGFPPSKIGILEKRGEHLEFICRKYGVQKALLGRSQVIFLAIKPQDLREVLDEIKMEIHSGTLVISLVAGAHTSFIESLLGRGRSVVRVMPNTPVLVRSGMSVIATGIDVSSEDISWVLEFFSRLGKTLMVDEKLMDAATAVSGSGPAYVYLFVEAMINSATKIGISQEDARILVHQTICGAVQMLSEEKKDTVTLIREVSSPGGTTMAALSVLESCGFEETIQLAVEAARSRSEQLSKLI